MISSIRFTWRGISFFARRLKTLDSLVLAKIQQFVEGQKGRTKYLGGTTKNQAILPAGLGIF